MNHHSLNKIQIASERLGHKDVLITFNKYSHMLSGVQEEIVKTFEKITFG